MKGFWIAALTWLIMFVASMALIASVTSDTMNATKEVLARDTRDTATVQAVGGGNPWINLRDGVDLPTVYTGAEGLRQVMEHNLAQG